MAKSSCLRNTDTIQSAILWYLNQQIGGVVISEEFFEQMLLCKGVCSNRARDSFF